MLVVSAEKSTHKGFNELAAHANATKGNVTYTSAGSGGACHLAGKLLEDILGTTMIHVPCKGGVPATTT